MSWQRYTRNRSYPFDSSMSGHSPFRVNKRCFIRKDHECGKVLAASKSCFIACPTDDELEPILELMSEKLMKHQIEPVIAVKERAYGQDIFCMKICGKIIESRFCIVILDDSIKEGTNIPNPNVYYEYGLMTALKKHIIPLQKDGQTLAFNIQSYDTIKYLPKNLSAELEDAIRDAIRNKESTGDEKESADINDRAILRKLEIAGFVEKTSNWILNSAIDDTLFRGFGCDREEAYMFLGKIDTEEDMATYLEDLDVIIIRTEKKFKNKEANIKRVEKELAKAQEKANKSKRDLIYFLDYELKQEVDNLPTDLITLERMERIYIAFIVNAELAIDDFKKHVNKTLALYKRYNLAISEESVLKIGDVTVNLSKTE